MWRGLTSTFGARIAGWYFALFVAGALVILVAAGLLLSASVARRDRDSLLAALERYTDAYRQGGAPVLEQIIAADRAAGSYEPLFVRVVAGGRTRLLSLPVEWSRFPLDRLAVPRPGAVTLQPLEDDGRTLEVASSWLDQGVIFQVGRTTDRRTEELRRYRETGFWLFALVVTIGLAGGVLVTSRALRPLQELRQTITQILETGRTTKRVNVTGTRDPLDALGTLVNRMLDQIDALIAGLRSSLDTVAHDLRTPLTRLRATAEMALQSPRSAEEYRDALVECLEELDRVRLLLDALMDLAEAETGALRLRQDTLDPVAVVRDAVDLYSGVAEEKGVELTLDAGNDVREISGDRARLMQVVANLIDNAIKYTAAPGTVLVTVRDRDPGVEIEVADTGEGIEAADLPRIWERLFRADRSRSQRGLGIGLSLVRAIVEAHGGRVTVESQVGRGSRFVVRLDGAPTQKGGARSAALLL